MNVGTRSARQEGTYLVVRDSKWYVAEYYRNGEDGTGAWTLIGDSRKYLDGELSHIGGRIFLENAKGGRQSGLYRVIHKGGMKVAEYYYTEEPYWKLSGCDQMYFDSDFEWIEGFPLEYGI